MDSKSSTFQWKVNQCFRPGYLAASPISAGQQALPAVLDPANFDARNVPSPISELLAVCIVALAPAIVVSSPPPGRCRYRDSDARWRPEKRSLLATRAGIVSKTLVCSV